MAILFVALLGTMNYSCALAIVEVKIAGLYKAKSIYTIEEESLDVESSVQFHDPEVIFSEAFISFLQNSPPSLYAWCPR